MSVAGTIKPHTLLLRFTPWSLPFTNPRKEYQGDVTAPRAIKGARHGSTNVVSKERTYFRHPIIINGAGPAGLILAIGLKNAGIPYEICERHRHDLPSKPRRNYPSLLSPGTLKSLKAFLRAPSSRSILDKIAVNIPAPRADDGQLQHYVKTESLLELLRRQVPVHYGFTLSYEGITCLESVVTSRFVVDGTIKTFEGSLVVGADGKFSSVRKTNNLFLWPAVTYVAIIAVPSQQYESYFKGFLNDEGSTALLLGSTRLTLLTTSEHSGEIFMSLWYSRMTTSPTDYNAFFGCPAYGRSIQPVSYKFDPMVAREIDSLQPLAPPFGVAYDICKDVGVSQKINLLSVQMAKRELKTAVTSHGLNLPAVLIGDAAHAIPETLSSRDINSTIRDAVILCSMIVDRYEDDVLFSLIPKDYYATGHIIWANLGREWEEKWMKAHGLPFDHREARLTWVPVPRTSRLEESQDMSESEFHKFSLAARRKILRYKEKGNGRRSMIESRIRSQFKQKNAFQLPPGVEPSKVV